MHAGSALSPWATVTGLDGAVDATAPTQALLQD